MKNSFKAIQKEKQNMKDSDEFFLFTNDSILKERKTGINNNQNKTNNNNIQIKNSLNKEYNIELINNNSNNNINDMSLIKLDNNSYSNSSKIIDKKSIIENSQDNKIENWNKDSLIIPIIEEEDSKNHINSLKHNFNINNKRIDVNNINETQYLKSSILKNNSQNLINSFCSNEDTIINSYVHTSLEFDSKLGSSKKKILNEKIVESIPINEIIYNELIDFDKRSKEISFKEFLGQNNFFGNNEKKDKSYSKQNGIKNNTIFKNLMNDSNNFLIKDNKQINFLSKISTNFTSQSFFLNLFYFIDCKERNKLYNDIKTTNNKEFLISQIIFSKNDFEKIYYIKQNFFEYFRYINPQNGDSFYRAFIFCLFEHCILKKDIKLFSILIYDIFRLVEIGDIYFHLNIEKALTILNIIYDLIRANEYENAYEILIKSFLKNDIDDLDQILIRYLRYSVYGYLINLDLENEFDYSIAIIYYNEPSKFIIESLINMFNVNLKLYYIEGNMKELKEIEFSSKNLSNINIELGYFFTNYHILYHEKLNLNNNLKYYIPDLSIILCGNKSNIQKICSNCKENCQYINLYKSDYLICSNCLKLKINQTLEERLQLFLLENYKNFSYYMRPIVFSKNPEIIISDSDCLHLFNYSFTNIWSSKIRNICNKCFKKEIDIIKLKCDCQYCKNCIFQLLNLSTNYYIILNRYEKKKIKKHQCQCGKNFDNEEVIKILKLDKDKKYIKNAQERMFSIVKKLCFICCKELQINIYVPSNKKRVNYYQIDIFIPNDFIGGDLKEGIDYNKENHLICRECYEKYSEDKEKYNYRYEEKEYKLIMCQICDLFHLIDKTQWKYLKPKTTCGCYIY